MLGYNFNMENQQVVHLASYSQHLSSRELASALRSRIGNAKVLFDFNGIQCVTPEFFDELFGHALENFGEKNFLEHVSWSGLSMGQNQALQDVLAKHKHKR